VGSVVDTIIGIDVLILIIFVVVSIPLFIVFRDIKSALKRYGLVYEKRRRPKKSGPIWKARERSSRATGL